MSVTTRVADRYAKALMLEGVEKSTLDILHKDFLLIEETAKASRDLQLMWMSPVIAPEKKEEILIKLFSGKVSETVISFLKLVNTKGRDAATRSIVKRFIELYNEHKGIAKVSVTSAVALDSNVAKDIQSDLEKALGKTVILDEKIEEDLIGGLIIRNQDLQLDMSVKSSLNKIKNKFAVQ